LIHDVIELSTCFRHVDSLYAKIMNEIRVGILSKTSNDILKSKVNKRMNHDHCIIYPNRYQVNKVNEHRLRQLDESSKHVYNPMCTEPFQLSKYEDIELRVGARVMCTANIETSGSNYIVNGSPGKVVSFRDGFPVVVFNNGAMRVMTTHEFPTDIDDVYVRHIPLMLAWAITIHKSQGITLESAEVDAGSGIFECGQTYVALSRLKTLDGLHLSAYDVRKVKVNRKVKQFYKSLNN
jgi:ATP-dependent DNA helicase PIF1